jgi:predicted nucleotidyltransferase component of viral defense system
MYKLQSNPILLPHQVAILRQFFADPFSRPFFLTGGTALAAFYLGHRDSKDFDLFSLEAFDLKQMDILIRKIAKTVNAEISAKVKTDDYHEIYFENKNAGWIQRIDIVHEQPIRFGDPIIIDGIRVDSIENIGSNKILTLFGRLEPKDYIDFYFIVTKLGLDFDFLYSLAKQKDLGLEEFYFANSISAIDQIKIWPTTKIPLDHQALLKFYRDLARNLLLRVKPAD